MTATGPATSHRIVVVGGGAGGLPLATKLGDRYGRDGRVQVTLVDRNATHVWKPLLHEVAAGRMDADAHDLDYLAIAHWHHFRFRQGAICGLDRARRELTLDAVFGPDGEEVLPRRTLPYDTLSCASAASATTSACRAPRSIRFRSTRSTTPSVSTGGCSPCACAPTVARRPARPRR